MHKLIGYRPWCRLKPSAVQRGLTALLLVMVLLVSACTSAPVETGASPLTSPVTSKPSMTPPAAESGIPPQFAKLPRLNGKATVVMTVKGAPITIEVDGTDAPLTAGNFVDLVSRGVYDGLVFHRVVREPQPFVVQGGDPQGKDPSVPSERLGTGGFIDPSSGQERVIPLEIKPADGTTPVYSKTFQMSGITSPPKLRHTTGAVAMARSQFPDSASSQFYFALTDLSFLDGQYAVFGYVKQGMDVVDKIQQGDRIESAKVTAGLENLQK